MLSSWLARETRNPSPYKFAVEDIGEHTEPDDTLKHYVAQKLLLAHANPEMLRRELQILADDAANMQLFVIREYIEQQVLPDKDKIATRVGNFGEIIASNYLVEFEGFTFPIYKLRFREKKDWSMRLTDLFLIKLVDGQPPSICYGEVKTKSSGCDLQLAVKGHNSLAKDDALSDPEILRFICVWLYETEMFEEAELFSNIRLGKIQYSKRHDLFLIHDKSTWTDQILDNLEICDLDNRLVDFSVKVLQIADLRTLIDTTYSHCSLAAVEVLDE
ncbi:MAG: hypothetical protein CYG59_09175 [Chloroflexi bacterium]|nr:MAG: hypothetical protein CYG59_09175 [Chloroflexota bacterium]